MGATCKKLHKQFIEINMKKLLACSLLCAFSLIANAQSIGSFLDFYLGQSISEAKIIVNSKYPSASWDNNKCTRLYSLLKSKYGKESYSTNNTLVWRGANGNSITIELRQTVEDVGYGSYAGTVAAFLTYELSSNLGNY